jgi:hypothetical protein
MTHIKASALAICERVAEAQALLHDDTEGGRRTADHANGQKKGRKPVRPYKGRYLNGWGIRGWLADPAAIKRPTRFVCFGSKPNGLF